MNSWKKFLALPNVILYTIEITDYGYDILYAGRRVDLIHAMFRQNMGVAIPITGCDHDCVGNCN